MSEQKNSSWLKSGAFSFLEKVAGLVFGLGSLFLLYRILPQEDLDTWLVFMIVTAIIEVGRAGLQQNAIVKYLNNGGDEKELGDILYSSTLNGVIITVLSILALLTLGGRLESALSRPGLANLLLIYCFSNAVLVFFQQASFLQQSNFDFKGIFYSNMAWKGSFFFFVLLVFFKGWETNPIELAQVQVGSAVLATIVSCIFALKYIPKKGGVTKVWMRKLFDFGIYGFGTNMSTMLHKNLDRLMLTTLLAGPVLVLYEWAVRLTLLIEVPTFSIASVVYPKSSEEIATKGPEALKVLYEKSVGAILAIVLPVITFVILFAYPIILILAGEQYIESANILRVTMLFGLFIPYSIMFGTVIDSMGLPRLNFIFTAGGFLTNIVANYFCITTFGVIGAAYGTLFSWFVLVFGGQVVLYQKLRVNFLKPFSHIIPFYKDGIQRISDYLNKSSLPKEKSI